MYTTVISFNLKFRLKPHTQQASAVSPSWLTMRKDFLDTAEFEVGMGVTSCVNFKKLRGVVVSENRTLQHFFVHST